jgi:uncharacterized protein YbbC (DUF1343 family)
MNASLAILLLLQAAPVKTGLDVLARDGFKPLQGKRVGLVTNHTGRDSNGTATIDLLAAAKGVTLAALFSPEHGIRGEADSKVSSGRDAKTGLPIHSLYGKTTKPTAEMLKDLDVLVYDIQDVGARFYTYITTLALVMEAAKENDKAIIILDRPNPIGGEAVEGPVLEDALRGDFIGYFPIPMRHGMTIGELATLYNTEFKIDCRLEVAKMEGWKRSMYFDDTGLTWIHPSPNMRSLAAANSYPGLGALEATSLSVGRGTGRAFVLYGAPWIDGKKLCDELNSRGLGGVRFKPATFTPSVEPGLPRYPHAEKECRGFEVEILDRTKYRPVTAALHAFDALARLYPKEFSFGKSHRFFGLRSVESDLKSGKSPAEIEKAWQPGLDRFLDARKKCLLYP